MNLKKQIIFGVAVASVFTACSNEDIPSAPQAPVQSVASRVNLNVRSFGDASRVESLASGYSTLNGYFFSQGKLSKQYASLSGSGSNYTIELPDSVGTLYFVANPASDFLAKVTPQITKEEFLKLTAGQEGVEACPMTTSVELNKMSEYGNLSATLVRAVARIDAQPVSDNVTITQITLSNVAQNGYYFAQEGVLTADGGTTTLSHDFDEPLATLQSGIFHLYEQTGSITAQVQANVNGNPRTFSTTLPADIERNHIYTLKVSSKSVQVAVNVGVGEWEQGEDTVIDADANL